MKWPVGEAERQTTSEEVGVQIWRGGKGGALEAVEWMQI
jgi:hypothetical protein